MPTSPAKFCLTALVLLLAGGCQHQSVSGGASTDAAWLLVADFESARVPAEWVNIDAQNDTDPHIPNPQVSVVRRDPRSGNPYLLRKPARDGVRGNRKAIGFVPLPKAVPVGKTYTFYTRVNVEYFPNNHSFGLANVPASEIAGQHYNAFEPMIRITDKWESDGSKNDGTLTVLSGDKTYSKIINPATGKSAAPLQPGTWYELWYVVNNARVEDGGQRYDVYVRGGEFDIQTMVFKAADFRMRRSRPLLFWMAISNTGPADKPYGNGGVGYDDIYMTVGESLSSPLR